MPWLLGFKSLCSRRLAFSLVRMMLSLPCMSKKGRHPLGPSGQFAFLYRGRSMSGCENTSAPMNHGDQYQLSETVMNGLRQP